MKVAIIHDWLTVYAGGEWLLEHLIKLFPAADLYSVIDFFSEKDRLHLLNKRATTTFIQKLPFARKYYRYYFPLMPVAIEQFDLNAYDLIISSSHAVAKGVITGPDQLHICYCHSPMRYAWDLQPQYIKDKKAPLKRWLLHKLRQWDVTSSNRVDFFVANSHFIERRIEKCYRRPAEVIYPPVALDHFKIREKKEDFYVTLSRLVPYKRVDLLVDAFKNMPERTLYVLGDGPEKKRLQQRASKNVHFLGHVTHEQLNDYLGKAKAFLYAAVEDFGQTPLQAQACGTPVIAYGKGAIMETIRNTGIFYSEQTPAAVQEAIELFEASEIISPQLCRQNAERFSQVRFLQNFSEFIEKKLDERIDHSGGERDAPLAAFTQQLP